jgi:hypothetical protein
MKKTGEKGMQRMQRESHVYDNKEGDCDFVADLLWRQLQDSDS